MLESACLTEIKITSSAYVLFVWVVGPTKIQWSLAAGAVSNFHFLQNLIVGPTGEFIGKSCDD